MIILADRPTRVILGKNDINKKLHVLIAKPNFGCSTKVIYNSLKNYSNLSFREKNKK